MGHLLCEEKLKHKESVRKHTEENTKLKKEVAKYKEKLKEYEVNFEAVGEGQNLEVVYNEEVISTDDNITYEKEVSLLIKYKQKYSWR